MPERTPIICKGRVPGTSLPCEAKICETDGEKFFVTGHGYEFAIEIDPPAITCNVCGFKNRLHFAKRKRIFSLKG